MKGIIHIIALMFIAMSVTAIADTKSNDKVEVNFSVEVNEDEFENLKVIGFLGQPVQLFLDHPNSTREYKFEVLVNEMTDEETSYLKVHLDIDEKTYDEKWNNVRSFQFAQHYGDDVEFSVGGDSKSNFSGVVSVVRYQGNDDENLTFTDCDSGPADGSVTLSTSCCSVKCDDGSGSILRCCGGLNCCGCGNCCQIP